MLRLLIGLSILTGLGGFMMETLTRDKCAAIFLALSGIILYMYTLGLFQGGLL